MGFLARSVKHRPVSVLIDRVTGVRARLGDSNGIRKTPITDEAIPHVRGELGGFATLNPFTIQSPFQLETVSNKQTFAFA